MKGKATEKKANKILDCRGLFCPEPVLQTRVILDQLEYGRILEVICNDPAAEQDIILLVKRLNFKMINVTKSNEEIRFMIQKSLP